MSSGDICKHCRHWPGDHNEEGKCTFSHPSWNKGVPCDCEKFELYVYAWKPDAHSVQNAGPRQESKPKD